MNRIVNAITAATCAAGLGSLHPARAGNLSKCDQERIAARNAVSGRYDALLSELEQRIAAATAAGTDPGKAAYRDKDNQPRSLDLRALQADLQAQKAHDAGSVDKAVAASCADRAETVADAVTMADARATRGITSVLPKYMTNIDLSHDPLRF